MFAYQWASAPEELLDAFLEPQRDPKDRHNPFTFCQCYFAIPQQNQSLPQKPK
jgi:hypothetical protein